MTGPISNSTPNNVHSLHIKAGGDASKESNSKAGKVPLNETFLCNRAAAPWPLSESCAVQTASLYYISFWVSRWTKYRWFILLCKWARVLSGASHFTKLHSPTHPDLQPHFSRKCALLCLLETKSLSMFTSCLDYFIIMCRCFGQKVS